VVCSETRVRLSGIVSFGRVSRVSIVNRVSREVAPWMLYCTNLVFDKIKRISTARTESDFDVVAMRILLGCLQMIHLPQL
jgi:hypothetical protein